MTGRKEICLRSFYDKLAFNTAAIGPAEWEHYVKAYGRPRAVGYVFDVYRKFLVDAEKNRN